MTRIKICGLFREEDMAYVNEARPDYAGFVFAESRRQVSPARAARLRGLLRDGIMPVGVFVNAPLDAIVPLYRDGVIDMVQLHGDEDAGYISRLKEASAGGRRGPAPLIKAFSAAGPGAFPALPGGADYYLIDSGRGGTGKAFDWKLIKELQSSSGLRDGAEQPDDSPPSFLPGARPWFLAGGIGIHNIEQALALKPFGIDVSGGVETGGFKDREKMRLLTQIVRKENFL
jgi:phosphoribosylanthranilate isomerase